MMAFGTAVSTPSSWTTATKAECSAGVHTMRGRLRPAGLSGPSLPAGRHHVKRPTSAHAKAIQLHMQHSVRGFQRGYVGTRDASELPLSRWFLANER